MHSFFSNITTGTMRRARKLRGWLGRQVALAIGIFPRIISFIADRSLDFLLSFFAMLVVVFKRLRHNLGLSISAILGVVAVLSLVVAVPVFSNAISSDVLREQLVQKASSTHRGLFSLHMYYIDNRDDPALNIAKTETVKNFIQTNLEKSLGLKIERLVTEVQTNLMPWNAEDIQLPENYNESWFSMGFFTSEQLPEHADLLEGAWPQPTTSPDGPIQVALLGDAADLNYVNVGDKFTSGDMEIEITGLWQPKYVQDSFWFDEPLTAYINKMWIPQETYRKRVEPAIDRPIFYVSWYVTVNETDLRLSRATQYAHSLVRFNSDLTRLLPGIKTDYSPLEALNVYQDRVNSLTTLFYAVGGPIIILALLFISLTATIAIQQYEQETATMRGRGTSWSQVLALNLTESLLLVLLAIPLSLIIGWLEAAIMRQTLSFLQFTNRGGIALSFQGVNPYWLLLAIGLIVTSRFFPVLGISRTTIIRVKQQQSRVTQKPLWERFYLDFLLLIPGIYAYMTMSGLTKSVKLLSRFQVAAVDRYRDILLFVAPALFTMAVCMIALRILPFILRILANLIDRLPGAWAYLSIQQIARRPQDHSSALLLIMISLSMAIYSASTAKTLDQWLHDSSYYKSGADLAVHEYVVQGGNQTAFGQASGGSSGTTLSELDMNIESTPSLEDHTRLPSIVNATRVGKYDGTFSYGVGESGCIFMGIDRLDFPNVAFFRDDFSNESLGALMNGLGLDPMGVLIPQDLANDTGLRLGDHLLSSVRILDITYDRDFVIAGTYRYFPTIFPGEKPTLIVNLDSIFDDPESVIGYDIWMKLRKETDTFFLLYQIRQLIGSQRAVVDVRGNAYDEVRTSMSEPERVGLFGVLNVGFMATGLMPGIGFVLYSYASLRRRFIQLGILQAIGLSVRQLIGHLVLEQSLLMGLALSIGAMIGLLTSYLFVPFFQAGTSLGVPVPPFEVLIGWVESGWLSLAFGFVLFLTMIGSILYLARIKVFQAVKMGEML